MDLVGDSVGDNWAFIGSGEDIYLSLEAIKLRKDTTVLLENRKCLVPIRIAMSSVLLGCIFHSDLPHTIITAHKTIWDIVYSNTYKRPIVSGMFMDKAYIHTATQNKHTLGHSFTTTRVVFRWMCPTESAHPHMALWWGYEANFITFPNYSEWSKHWLPRRFHVHIWHVSPQLSWANDAIQTRIHSSLLSRLIWHFKASLFLFWYFTFALDLRSAQRLMTSLGMSV